MASSTPEGVLGHAKPKKEGGRLSLPRPLSEGEETFAMHCAQYGLAPVREYKFCDRRWKFDFAWPSVLLAVEIEGGTKFGKSRHSRGQGFEQDCRKYNEASKLGWTIFRFSTAMVKSAEAIDFVREFLR